MADTETPNIHVAESGGDGRPVVLIHGWPLSNKSWSQQVGPLKEAGYRVVAYDRRGFGESDPGDGYDYDKLTDDLANVLEELDLNDVTLVGFSMGGGEVARYGTRHGFDRIHSVVFASAVPPFLMQSDENPDGPLTEDAAGEMESGLKDDRDAFFDDFVTQFFSAGDELKVTDEQVQEAITLCKLSDQEAAVGCMEAFGTTDFRDDLANDHRPDPGDPRRQRRRRALRGLRQADPRGVEGSELVVIEGGPHGCNVSHAERVQPGPAGLPGEVARALGHRGDGYMPL